MKHQPLNGYTLEDERLEPTAITHLERKNYLPNLQGIMFHVNLQETNISPKNGSLKMICLFPRWDMLISWRVIFRGEAGSICSMSMCRFVDPWRTSWRAMIFMVSWWNICAVCWRTATRNRVTCVFKEGNRYKSNASLCFLLKEDETGMTWKYTTRVFSDAVCWEKGNQLWDMFLKLNSFDFVLLLWLLVVAGSGGGFWWLWPWCIFVVVVVVVAVAVAVAVVAAAAVEVVTQACQNRAQPHAKGCWSYTPPKKIDSKDIILPHFSHNLLVSGRVSVSTVLGGKCSFEPHRCCWFHPWIHGFVRFWGPAICLAA